MLQLVHCLITSHLLLMSQEAKLASLEAALQHREEQIENRHAERINAFKAQRSLEVQHRLALMHR